MRSAPFEEVCGGLSLAGIDRNKPISRSVMVRGKVAYSNSQIGHSEVVPPLTDRSFLRIAPSTLCVSGLR